MNIFGAGFFLIFCLNPLSDGIQPGFFGGAEIIKKETIQNNISSQQDYPDYVRAVSSKVKKVHKNEKGFWEAEFENGIIMIYIPPGEFQMGSDNGKNNEKPLRNLYLDGYWIGKYEVTFDQYDQFCTEQEIDKPDDEGWGREGRPVINVSWEDAIAYCRWLSEKMGYTFSLPTEAQWEKSARGTDGRMYPWGNSEPSDSKANFAGYSRNLVKPIRTANHESRSTVPVGSHTEGSSPYGVMDLAGNVYEWCYDRYSESNLSPSRNSDRHNPKKGTYHVIRGGSWFGSAYCLRTTFRTSAKPNNRYFHIGFRLCLE